MFDALAENVDPAVLPPLPHRIVDGFEIGIVERAERDRHQVGKVATAIIYRRAALGAEMIGGLLAAIGGADPLFGLAFDLNALRLPSRLGGEGAAGALLAGEAVAGRDAYWVAFDHHPKLAAAAGGGASGHFASAFSILRHTSATASTAGLDAGNSSPTGERSRLIRS